MKQKYYDVAAVRDALTSIVPSISTPFLENGDIDYPALKRMTDFLIASGAKTLLLTYGDSILSLLTDSEVEAVTKAVVDAAGGRAMVIGCGKPWCLPQTVAFAQACADMGCDMVIPVAPDWAQHGDSRMLQQYFEAIGAIMPTMLLSNMMSSRGIPMDIYERLSPDSGIVAVKDDMVAPYGCRMGPIIRDKMAFLSGGRLENFLITAPYGADGYLSIFARMFPELEKPYFQACLEGRYADAARFVEIYEAPFLQWCGANGAHFDAGIRGMLEIAGLCGRFCRMPYSHLTDGQMESLRQFLQQRKVI